MAEFSKETFTLSTDGEVLPVYDVKNPPVAPEIGNNEFENLRREFLAGVRQPTLEFAIGLLSSPCVDRENPNWRVEHLKVLDFLQERLDMGEEELILPGGIWSNSPVEIFDEYRIWRIKEFIEELEDLEPERKKSVATRLKELFVG